MTEPTLAVRESAELTGRRWTFGPAVLDERSLELHVNGERVELERKPLEVLLYLLHHAGEVVTKDDLGENLWPGRILTESVLSRCISLLRQALRDDDRTLIRTVHGFGYRLVARVRVEASAGLVAPKLDFRPGDCPPTRPHWRLVERLGAGGHGEAWLARHDKTGDARVFKFAVDAGALSSLKREITLYRLLHDTLGARAAVARIYEWNLEEPPYFIEMEYVPGGNLATWFEAQGGLSQMPLPARIELVAQVADALASAHSVGALHKDLKPGNVLIKPEGDRPLVKLCDFGSGALLDPNRLEALGITRLGFTQTMASDAATPLYLAPEVIAGQPYTLQADIYSLAVLLYQVVTGDLRRALAPGWESDIEDELLREDIAAAAAGNPSRRLPDAAQLAERLRTLEQRREARASEAAARQRAERARRVQEELRRTRVFAALLVALTIAAVAGGVAAYRARDNAVAATATARAISEFLMEDVLRMDSGLFKPSEGSYDALLSRAADRVSVRLKDQPEAAASVHSLLGRRFQEIGRFESATKEYERAVAVSTAFHGEAAEPTLMALDRLAWIYLETGRVAEALALTQRIRTLWESLLAPSDLAMLMVRTRLARNLLASGNLADAERELRSARGMAADAVISPIAGRLFRQWLGISPHPDVGREVVRAYSSILLAGNVLEENASDLTEAEALLRESHAIFLKVLGADAELSALSSVGLAAVLASSGQMKEAEEHALRVRHHADKVLPANHYANALSRLALGRVRKEQGRFREAATLLEDAVRLCTATDGCPPRLRAELLWGHGLALSESGEWRAAEESLRSSLEIQSRILQPQHVLFVRTRISLAEILVKTGRLEGASAMLSEVSGYLASGTAAPLRGDFNRAQGLLLMRQGAHAAAMEKFEEAVAIQSRRGGSRHWHTRRAHSELAEARRSEMRSK